MKWLKKVDDPARRVARPSQDAIRVDLEIVKITAGNNSELLTVPHQVGFGKIVRNSPPTFGCTPAYTTGTVDAIAALGISASATQTMRQVFILFVEK